MATKEAFENDLDATEALEAAIDKRKFLLNRLFSDKRVTDSMEGNDSNKEF